MTGTPLYRMFYGEDPTADPQQGQGADLYDIIAGTDAGHSYLNAQERLVASRRRQTENTNEQADALIESALHPGTRPGSVGALPYTVLSGLAAGGLRIAHGLSNPISLLIGGDEAPILPGSRNKLGRAAEEYSAVFRRLTRGTTETNPVSMLGGFVKYEGNDPLGLQVASIAQNAILPFYGPEKAVQFAGNLIRGARVGTGVVRALSGTGFWKQMIRAGINSGATFGLATIGDEDLDLSATTDFQSSPAFAQRIEETLVNTGIGAVFPLAFSPLTHGAPALFRGGSRAVLSAVETVSGLFSRAMPGKPIPISPTGEVTAAAVLGARQAIEARGVSGVIQQMTGDLLASRQLQSIGLNADEATAILSGSIEPKDMALLKEPKPVVGETPPAEAIPDMIGGTGEAPPFKPVSLPLADRITAILERARGRAKQPVEHLYDLNAQAALSIASGTGDGEVGYARGIANWQHAVEVINSQYPDRFIFRAVNRTTRKAGGKPGAVLYDLLMAPKDMPNGRARLQQAESELRRFGIFRGQPTTLADGVSGTIERIFPKESKVDVLRSDGVKQRVAMTNLLPDWGQIPPESLKFAESTFSDFELHWQNSVESGASWEATKAVFMEKIPEAQKGFFSRYLDQRMRNYLKDQLPDAFLGASKPAEIASPSLRQLALSRGFHAVEPLIPSQRTVGRFLGYGTVGGLAAVALGSDDHSRFSQALLGAMAGGLMGSWAARGLHPAKVLYDVWGMLKSEKGFALNPAESPLFKYPVEVLMDFLDAAKKSGAKDVEKQIREVIDQRLGIEDIKPAEGDIPPTVSNILKRLDNLGFDTAGEARHAILDNPDFDKRWDIPAREEKILRAWRAEKGGTLDITEKLVNMMKGQDTLPFERSAASIKPYIENNFSKETLTEIVTNLYDLIKRNPTDKTYSELATVVEEILSRKITKPLESSETTGLQFIIDLVEGGGPSKGNILNALKDEPLSKLADIVGQLQKIFDTHKSDLYREKASELMHDIVKISEEKAGFGDSTLSGNTARFAEERAKIKDDIEAIIELTQQGHDPYELIRELPAGDIFEIMSHLEKERATLKNLDPNTARIREIAMGKIDDAIKKIHENKARSITDRIEKAKDRIEKASEIAFPGKTPDVEATRAHIMELRTQLEKLTTDIADEPYKLDDIANKLEEQLTSIRDRASARMYLGWLAKHGPEDARDAARRLLARISPPDIGGEPNTALGAAIGTAALSKQVSPGEKDDEHGLFSGLEPLALGAAAAAALIYGPRLGRYLLRDLLGGKLVAVGSERNAREVLTNVSRGARDLMAEISPFPGTALPSILPQAGPPIIELTKKGFLQPVARRAIQAASIDVSQVGSLLARSASFAVLPALHFFQAMQRLIPEIPFERIYNGVHEAQNEMFRFLKEYRNEFTRDVVPHFRSRAEQEGVTDFLETGGAISGYIDHKGNFTRFTPIQETAAKKLEDLYAKAGTVFGVDMVRFFRRYAPHLRLMNQLGMIDDINDPLLWLNGKTPKAASFFADFQRDGGNLYERNAFEAYQQYIRRGAFNRIVKPRFDEAVAVANAVASKNPHLAAPVQMYLESVRGTPSKFDKVLNTLTQDTFRLMGIRVSNRAFENFVHSMLGLSYASMIGVRPGLILRNAAQLVFTSWPNHHPVDIVAGLEFAMSPEGRKIAARYGATLDQIAGIPFGDLMAANPTAQPAISMMNDMSRNMPTFTRALSPANITQKSLWAYSNVDDLTRTAEFGSSLNKMLRHWGKYGDQVVKDAEGALNRPYASKFRFTTPEEKFLAESGLRQFTMEQQRHFYELYHKSGKDAATFWYASNASQERLFRYGQANQVGLFRGTVGRLYGQFGIWPQWYGAYVASNMVRGTGADRALFLTRLATSYTAIYAAAQASDLDPEPWLAYPSRFVIPRPGPLAGVVLDALNLGFSTLRGRNQDAQMQISRLRHSWSLVVPNYTFFARDVPAGLEALQSGQPDAYKDALLNALSIKPQR